MSKTYQNCVVAVIDLLGFKEAVKIVENAEEILAILQQIKKAKMKFVPPMYVPWKQ
jgi:hypothetical protein